MFGHRRDAGPGQAARRRCSTDRREAVGMLGGRIGVLTNYPYRVTIVTITTSEPDFGRHDLRHSADREIGRVILNRTGPNKVSGSLRQVVWADARSPGLREVTKN